MPDSTNELHELSEVAGSEVAGEIDHYLAARPRPMVFGNDRSITITLERAHWWSVARAHAALALMARVTWPHDERQRRCFMATVGARATELPLDGFTGAFFGSDFARDDIRAKFERYGDRATLTESEPYETLINSVVRGVHDIIAVGGILVEVWGDAARGDGGAGGASVRKAMHKIRSLEPELLWQLPRRAKLIETWGHYKLVAPLCGGVLLSTVSQAEREAAGSANDPPAPGDAAERAVVRASDEARQYLLYRRVNWFLRAFTTHLAPTLVFAHELYTFGTRHRSHSRPEPLLDPRSTLRLPQDLRALIDASDD